MVESVGLAWQDWLVVVAYALGVLWVGWIACLFFDKRREDKRTGLYVAGALAFLAVVSMLVFYWGKTEEPLPSATLFIQ